MSSQRVMPRNHIIRPAYQAPQMLKRTRLRDRTECMATALFMCIIFFGPIIDVLLNPGAESRDDVFNYWSYLVCACLVMIVPMMLRYISSPAQILIFCALVMIWRFLAYWIPTGRTPLFRLVAEPGMVLAGYLVASRFNRRAQPMMLLVVLIGAITSMLFSYYAWHLDLLRFRDFLDMGLSTSLRNEILVSTELANIAAQIAIISVFLALGRREERMRKSQYALVLASIAVQAVLVLYLFSVGTMGAFLLMCLILSRKKPWRAAAIFVAVVVFLAMWSDLPVSEIIPTIISGKEYQAEVRLWAYSRLIGLIANHPITGVGIEGILSENGFYPHQNILGTFAVGGVFFGTYYLMILAINALAFWRFALSGAHRKSEPLLQAAVWSLFYWHFKGLVQDTWGNLEFFVWTGVALFYLWRRTEHSPERQKPCNF